ncbi:MAG: acyl-CoA dehydrogenase family protein, partial [Chloroflexota bacterium]
MSMEETFPELRRTVRAVLRDFPDRYWQELDRQRAYPEAFVEALTAARFLAAMIPTKYGGLGLGLIESSVILEEINRSG